MFVAARLDPAVWAKWAWPVYGVGAALLLLVAAGAGVSSLGAERTLALGPVPFQPSEAAKIGLVFVLARWYSRSPKENASFGRGFLLPLLLCGAPVGLIMVQPDLGTAVTLTGTAFLMMAAAGARPRYLAAMVVLGVLLVAAAIALEPFRAARFTAFLDPWQDPQGYGFQTVQSLIAIGSGGVTGVGLGGGSAKWYYLPEVHTDFIFALIGEELGLIGAAFTVTLFAAVLWRGLRIALGSEDLFLSLLAFGLTAEIGVQAFINFFVATGMMPVTGIALPFISYGGSSLVFSLAAVGVVLAVSRRLPPEKRQR